MIINGKEMTAREWLNRGWLINKEVETLERTRLNLYLQCTRITTVGSPGSSSVSLNPHKFDRYAEFSAKVDARIRDLTQVSAEIFGAICRVSDSRYRMLLYHRYMNFMKWETIAEIMGYSRVHITRMHSEALCEIENVLECYTSEA